MKFLILKTHSPYLNLAIEEYFFEHTTDDVFMLWQNEPTVVIGKNQNAYAEINMNYVAEKGINVSRRITGGGAVYHDFGNVNYTFISTKENNGIDFAYFTKPIIEALDSLGIVATLSGRNDLLIGEKKFSGNAQFTRGNRVLHHGTLLFDSDLDVLTSALNVDEEKIKSKAIKSARSRVANLKDYIPSAVSVNDFIDIIAKFTIDKYSPEIIDAPNNDIIDALTLRNSSSEWIYPKKEYLSSYSLVKKKRYPFGTVEMYIDMSNDVLKKISILGDFFGISDISELEALLIETKISDVQEKLSRINIEDYILGMTNEIFLEHIK